MAVANGPLNVNPYEAERVVRAELATLVTTATGLNAAD
jgi:hypothetical protein